MRPAGRRLYLRPRPIARLSTLPAPATDPNVGFRGGDRANPKVDGLLLLSGSPPVGDVLRPLFSVRTSRGYSLLAVLARIAGHSETLRWPPTRRRSPQSCHRAQHGPPRPHARSPR